MLVPRNMYAVEVRALLEEIAGVCAALPESQFDAEMLGMLLAKAADRCGCGGKDWVMPLLVALAGRAEDVEPEDVMAALGKMTTVRRLTVAINKLRDTA